ncbi:MAG: gliding motility lipoprotein GldH [Bacteroidales bacterium]
MLHHTARRFPALVAIALLLLAGCDRSVVYEQNIEVEEKGWENRRFKRYSFVIQDTAIPYNFYINIRNNTDYPYANLFLFIRTILPDQTAAQDTVDIAIAGPDGKWLGSGIGKHRDNQVLIMPQFRFPQRGEYIFEIEHAMRETALTGISAVGIRVERSTKK